MTRTARRTARKAADRRARIGHALTMLIGAAVFAVLALIMGAMIVQNMGDAFAHTQEGATALAIFAMVTVACGWMAVYLTAHCAD
jgi:divalent metal cation (Fe/Co/Zn/Cd) transporter